MRFLFSIKAAVIYLVISTIFHAFWTIFFWGMFFNTITSKPVYPLLNYLNQTVPNPIIILSNFNIQFLPWIMLSIPVLNILSILISATYFIRSKKRNIKKLSGVLMLLALSQWLLFSYFIFFIPGA